MSPYAFCILSQVNLEGKTLLFLLVPNLLSSCCSCLIYSLSSFVLYENCTSQIKLVFELHCNYLYTLFLILFGSCYKSQLTWWSLGLVSSFAMRRLTCSREQWGLLSTNGAVLRWASQQRLWSRKTTICPSLSMNWWMLWMSDKVNIFWHPTFANMWTWNLGFL